MKYTVAKVTMAVKMDWTAILQRANRLVSISVLGVSGLAFRPANGTSRFPFPFFPSLMQVLLHVACPINAFNPAVRERANSANEVRDR